MRLQTKRHHSDILEFRLKLEVIPFKCLSKMVTFSVTSGKREPETGPGVSGRGRRRKRPEAAGQRPRQDQSPSSPRGRGGGGRRGAAPKSQARQPQRPSRLRSHSNSKHSWKKAKASTVGLGPSEPQYQEQGRPWSGLSSTVLGARRPNPGGGWGGGEMVAREVLGILAKARD